MYRLTGSALALGLVAFAGQLPALLLGPLAGALIERAPIGNFGTFRKLQSFPPGC